MNQCIAYLITLTCYGTWLHGDERTSVDRDHNIPGSPRLVPNVIRQQLTAGKLRHREVHLNAKATEIIASSVKIGCECRNWHLHALAVRTNHVHAVVSASLPPERVMHAFKSYATREMRNQNLCKPEDRLWTRHGSTRYLWTSDDLRRAIAYVMEGQGGVLPGSIEKRTTWRMAFRLTATGHACVAVKLEL